MNATFAVNSYEAKRIPTPRVAIYIIVGIIISLLLSVALDLPITLGLILGAQLTLLSLVIYRRVFLVAALLVGQLTVSNYMIYVAGTPISVRFLWTIIAVVFLFFIHFRERKTILGKRGWKVLTPALLLVVCAIISNLINTNMDYTLQYLRTAATSLVIILLIPAVIEEERDVKILGLTALITCSISAVFAILQHFHIGLLPISLTIFGSNNFAGTRAIGLNDSPVDLSFTLPLILLPAIALFFFKGINDRYRVLLVLAIVAMAAAEYFSYTRSGMYAMGAGLIALPLFMKSKMRTQIFLAALVLIAGFIIYTDMKNNRYTGGVTNESSAAGRLVLWQAGAKIAMSSPVLGIGGQAFKEAAQEYISSVSYNPSVVQAEEVLGVEQPHNDFLRTWVSYGTVALIALVWLLIMIFRNFLISYRFLTTRLGKGIALGCFAAFVAYAVNAFTHNVIDEVALIWMFAGLSIALCKIAANQKKQKPQQLKASE
ncbi:MAG: O-antigen ligase family protein [Dehalococcoidales bacterium]|jgi:O-antigen ligase